MSHIMCKDYGGWFNEDIRSIVTLLTLNTKNYIRLFFEDFLQISVKKVKQLIIKVIQYKLSSKIFSFIPTVSILHTDLRSSNIPR